MSDNLPFNHSIPIQIRFSDLDRLGHVNNACFLNYFELGRVQYFHGVLNDRINWDVEGFILARTEIDHFEPLYLTDAVRCETRISSIGNKSITMENRILKMSGDDEIVAASGKGILVAMNYSKNESMPVPEAWRVLIRSYEGLK